MTSNLHTRCPRPRPDGRKWRWAVTLPACLLLALAVSPARGQGNLLKNPGFEETPRDGGAPPGWERTGPGAAWAAEIDERVARLHGLTPEERKIVESASAGAAARQQSGGQ